MKVLRRCRVVFLLGTGSILIQGCPVGGLFGGFFDDCFGSNTISDRAFDDLNVFERVLYEENDCGRYEPISSVLDDIL